MLSYKNVLRFYNENNQEQYKYMLTINSKLIGMLGDVIHDLHELY